MGRTLNQEKRSGFEQHGRNQKLIKPETDTPPPMRPKVKSIPDGPGPEKSSGSNPETEIRPSKPEIQAALWSGKTDSAIWSRTKKQGVVIPKIFNRKRRIVVQFYCSDFLLNEMNNLRSFIHRNKFKKNPSFET